MADRRDFLTAAASVALTRRAWQSPTLVLHRGSIVTMNPAAPRAQAVAILGDRLLALGSNQEILRLAGPTTRRVDLGGRTVVPGFIDAHSHPASSGLQHLTRIDCDLRSIADIQAAVRARAAQTPPGQWVLGFKYDDTKTKEGRPLTRSDLDHASTTHPVLIEHRGGHTAYLNSKAFDLAGITESTADPPGGHIDRDGAGRPTGRLAETAVNLASRMITEDESPDRRREGVKFISRALAKAGITSVHDASASIADWRAYQDARANGELGTRIYALIWYGEIDQVIAAGSRRGLGDEWVRLGGVKCVCDGSISERTARMSEPYVGRPDDRGILVSTAEQLWPVADKVHRAGLQIGIHANGDVGIDIVLSLYERLQREAPRADPRFRIEHCTLVTPDLVRRIKALGAIPTPFSSYVYWHGEKMREYGADRLERMFALRSLIDAGVRPTFASDYPPGPFEPMMGLQSMVTRTDMKGTVWGGSQRITVDEAIRVATVHGAYASFEESQKGSLEAGKLADLVVLGRDPYREPPASLVSIPIERTMVGGRWVYEA
ncbi:MAG: amidohydrolase [Gemmatimonadetes bacterium]|nr:amidohydrolase [Gemmatimonadota bacterium]